MLTPRAHNYFSIVNSFNFKAVVNSIYNVAAYVTCDSRLVRMAVAIKKDVANRPEKDLLKGVDEAWEEYKLGKGKRIASDEELDAFINSL